MKTKAAKLVAPKRFEVVDVELPQIARDEVLIKVIACGICTTELPVFDGLVVGTPGVSFRYKEYPASLGHEVVGTVVTAGEDAAGFTPGDPVTGMTYSGCGFAQHMIEKANKLVKVPADVRLEHALGEPLMSVVNVMRQAAPEFGDDVFIVGDGFLSLLLVAGLAHYPLSNLIIAGHHENRLSLAMKFGATTALNSHRSDPWQRVMELTEEKGAEVSIDLAGTPAALRLAASVCKAKSRARLVLAATYSNEMPITVGNYLQNRAPILVVAYPNQSLTQIDDVRRGLWALSRGIFPMDQLVTHRFKLSDLNEAMEVVRARKDGYIKGIVLPWA